MRFDNGVAAPKIRGCRAAKIWLAAAAILTVAGCSSSGGDALTLGKAFEKKETKAGGKKSQEEGAGAAAAREAEKKPYPNLSTVPGRPNVTTQERRLQIEEGLLADRSRAKHTDATPVWARPKTADVATGDQPGGEPKVETVTVAGARLATIRFPPGSARLPPGAAGLMRQIAAIQKRSGAKVIAVGHTSPRKRSADADKDKKAKEALSLARANAVTSLLARLGVQEENLEAIGRADTEPTNPRRPFLNRRVDIFMRR